MYSKKHFPNQKPDEKIVFFLRRHWIAVLKIFIIGVIISLLPLLIYFTISNEIRFFSTQAGYAIIAVFASAYYLFVILYTFTNFIDYYLDVWIVTDSRVINIEQKGLFGRELSEKDLGRMQDITSDVKGFWATVFKYGNVHIQTAGEQQRFAFKQVPDAENLTRQISNLVAEYQRQHPSAEGKESRI